MGPSILAKNIERLKFYCESTSELAVVVKADDLGNLCLNESIYMYYGR